MPRTGQLADATGDYACLIFVFGHILIFCLYLNIYYANISVSCVICPHCAIKITNTTAGGIRETATCPVRDLSSSRVDQSMRCLVCELAVRNLAYPRVVQLPSHHGLK